ncbi:MAG: 3-methyl-2-oxobutanoate dehydrogenase subunit VorB [Thermoanaerobacteraceae bacterium]|nr:3-methyl-2-oxobutanoate dehydrogenase subunit VorB [Thermoanaerobacteraceae bacterium]
MAEPKKGRKELWKGTRAVAEAAVRAGCSCYFGYPITPQNDLLEYMSERLPACGGSFIQAESELSAINMVYGAAAAGGRAMTSSSGPGFSLMQEGISFIAGARLPCVIVYVARGGPGCGTILGAQADYFQVTRGGGHGDYRCIVLAPTFIQEAVNFTMDAFELADRYRMPVVVYMDGFLGQMMEGINMPERIEGAKIPAKEWAVSGEALKRGKRNVITSYWFDERECMRANIELQKVYAEIGLRESRSSSLFTEDAEYLIVSYGIAARVAMEAILELRRQGVRMGLFRPQTLWPFPAGALQEACKGVKGLLVVELSMGQMVEDVLLAVAKQVPVSFKGFAGGVIPSVDEVVEAGIKISRGELINERGSTGF